METLILNDGTVIENAHCIQVSDRLFVYVLEGMNLRRGFELFSDPERVSVIKSNRYGEEAVFNGFTELQSLSYDGQLVIGLRKVV